MFQNFRLSMAWLHTWFGLVLGFVLMVVFFFGALSVFDREIDRWAIPSSRFAPQPMPSFDQMLKPNLESMQPSADRRERMRDQVYGPLPDRFDVPKRWGFYSTHRDPVLGLFVGYEVPNAKKPGTTIWARRTIDPRTGAGLPDDHLKIGSSFFYPLHYSLTWYWKGVGYWIVGLAALAMLAALVSGVVMHRKLFRELFTFRPRKNTQRGLLDLHNLTGVVALPFHFFFAFTGLVIFAGIYFPVTHTQLEPLHEFSEQREADETGLPHERAGIAAPLASVDSMVAEARRRWAGRGMAGEVGFLAVQFPYDANGYVSIYRAGTDRIALTGEGVHFRAATGEVLREDPSPSAVDSVNEFLTGLHLQHFRHWLLRWLYVLGGLAGCACIATGLLSFVEKRKKRHAETGSRGCRVVDGGDRSHGHACRHAEHIDRQPAAARDAARGMARARRPGTASVLGSLGACNGARVQAIQVRGPGKNQPGVARAMPGHLRAGPGGRVVELAEHWRPSIEDGGRAVLAGGWRGYVPAGIGGDCRAGRGEAEAPRQD